MNYPVELKWREAAAIRLRRGKACTLRLSEVEINEAGSTITPPGSERDQLPPRTVGLALSGGGIRCATFSLGVLQALAKKNRLRSIDILSTVSGGGYIGSFLGRLFTRGAIREEKFDPCGRVQAIIGDNNSLQLRWLRTHANYIVNQGGSDVREHLAVFWRNLATIYFILAILGVALFGLLRLAGEWFRHSLPPKLAASLGSEFVEAVSSWWWLPLAVLAVAMGPVSIAYWLAPKSGTRASFSFFPLVGWIVLLAGLAATLALTDGLFFGLGGIAVVLLAIMWLEVARSHLPQKLDPSAGETMADAGTVIRNRLTRGLGEVLVVLLACLLWVVIDTIARGLAQGTLWKLVAAWGALLVSIAPFFRRWATLLGATGRQNRKDRDGRSSGFLSSRELRAGLVAFPVAAFLLVVLDGGVHWLFIHDRCWGIALTLLGIALSVVFGRAFDFLNYSSLQQSYGSRLSRTFLGASNPARFRAASHEEGRDVEVVHPDDDIDFDKYHPEENGGPLHLIGLCINETVDAASQRDIRDRKGLSMCVSPCGVSVGRRFHAIWSKTPEKLPWRARLRCLLDGRNPVTSDRPTALRAIPAGSDIFHPLKGQTDAPVAAESLRLGTWIAVSGAAFGTGTGHFTSLPLALLLGLVNLRLGYWWDSGLRRSERPGQYPANLWRRLKRWPASLVKMQSLLLSDFQGRFSGPSDRFWNISDGGHFDVTGIYELIRRRVPLIIAVDGGEDLKLTFVDCGDLVRQARIDFGASVEFLNQTGNAQDTAVPDWIKGWLNPGTLGPLSKLGQSGGKYAALAKVTYEDELGHATWIVLLKSSVTGDEPLDIAAYKRTHPDFPGESTTDQFFDEAQWESYRMLGEHIGTIVFA